MKQVFRVVTNSFWTDTKVGEFTPEEKYFFLYLLTNIHTTQLGIYEISIKQMSCELGYANEKVKELLERFETVYKMVIYSNDTKEIAILNYLKYSVVRGGTPVETTLKSEINRVKNRNLLDIVFKHAEQCRIANYSVMKVISEYKKYNGKFPKNKAVEHGERYTGETPETEAVELGETYTGEMLETEAVEPGENYTGEKTKKKAVEPGENTGESPKAGTTVNADNTAGVKPNRLYDIRHNNKQNQHKNQYFSDKNLNKAFENFVKMRAEIKKPLTTPAINKYIADVKKLSMNKNNEFDTDIAIKILNKSVLMSWANLYPLGENPPKQNKAPAQNNKFNIQNQNDYNFDEIENSVLCNDKEVIQ